MFKTFKPKQKQTGLAAEMIELGHNAYSHKVSPESACVIRSLNGYHHDVFIKKTEDGNFRLKFKDTLINQVVDVVTVNCLSSVLGSPENMF